MTGSLNVNLSLLLMFKNYFQSVLDFPSSNRDKDLPPGGTQSF